MDIYKIDQEQLTELANGVKEELVFILAREDLLKCPAESINKNFAIIIYRKNLLGKIWDKARMFRKDSTIRISVVKCV